MAARVLSIVASVFHIVSNPSRFRWRMGLPKVCLGENLFEWEGVRHYLPKQITHELNRFIFFPGCFYTLLSSNKRIRQCFLWTQCLSFLWYISCLLAHLVQTMSKTNLSASRGLYELLHLCRVVDGFERPHKYKSFVTGRQHSALHSGHCCSANNSTPHPNVSQHQFR